MTRVLPGRVGALVGLIRKNGFTVSLIPYPNKKGAWMLEVVPTIGAKASFKIPLAKNSDTVKWLSSIRVGGTRALYNYSRAIGAIGEARLVTRIRAGGVSFPNSLPPPPMIQNAQFDDVFSIQNRSGHGIDLMARLQSPSPPAPKWVAFEAKTAMETNQFPPLSADQARSATSFVQTRAQRALDGIRAAQRGDGTTWTDMIPHRSFIRSIEQAAGRNDIITVHAKVRLDRHGDQVGNITMEAW